MADYGWCEYCGDMNSNFQPCFSNCTDGLTESEKQAKKAAYEAERRREREARLADRARRGLVSPEDARRAERALWDTLGSDTDAYEKRLGLLRLLVALYERQIEIRDCAAVECVNVPEGEE